VPAAPAVSESEQLAEAPLPAGSEQLVLVGVAPVTVKLTVPLGVLIAPGDVSVTVATQVLV
jgi:hypothetical protein